jgi:DNA-binding transcriptional LysR family regulator
MDDTAHGFDWTHIRAFLVVAETGSLSAAARALGLSQPTLGRHIRALEDRAGGALFTRNPRGLTLTERGRSLRPGAAAMRDAARAMELAAAGRDDRAAGPVRLTASVYVSVYILPPILAKLRLTHPEIEIELVPSDASENLLFHEADIALRMYRPEQLEMITRHLGDLPLGFYATPDYLARKGTPQDFADLLGHDVVGYDRDDRIVKGFREAGLPVSRDWFAVRCDDQVAYWELTCAGCGIGIAQTVVGEADRRVTRVLPDASLPALPVWITAHETTRHTPRVSAVWAALVAGLARVLS